MSDAEKEIDDSTKAQNWEGPIAAFSRKFMLETIGFGMPIISGSMFKGFLRSAAPERLDCSIWFDMVPESHKEIAAAAVTLSATILSSTGIPLKDVRVENFVDAIRENLYAYYVDDPDVAIKAAAMCVRFKEFTDKKRTFAIQPKPPTP